MTTDVKEVISNGKDDEDFLSQDRYTKLNRTKTRQQIRDGINQRRAEIYSPQHQFEDYANH